MLLLSKIDCWILVVATCVAFGLSGCEWPILKREKALQPSPTSTVAISPARANAELLQEVYRVVFGREPKNRADFGNYVDSMNQGASIEGIYNGFTHSSQYRELELENRGASPQALKFFLEELQELQKELPTPTQFNSQAALPLQPIGVPSGQDGPPTESDPVSADQNYEQVFVGASIFTLKRVLGDEVLKVIQLKRDYPEKLALWYSKWAVRLMKNGVGFGLQPRNRADEAFHYRWAIENSEDRVKWEALNRVHRILNEANRER